MAKYVLSIDQGTSSTRTILFNVDGEMQEHFHQVEFTQIRPFPGWLEHDPEEILNTVLICIEKTVDKFKAEQIVAIGIANQRETMVVWDKFTGKPLYNAIVWSDVRTSDLVSSLKKANNGKLEKRLREISGLPVATYFSAIKLKWLMENVESVNQAIENDTCLFGTIDSWLIWNLTGGVNGGNHVTDVTNASRTMLFNLKTLQWDEEACQLLGVPMRILPKISSCSSRFGVCKISPLSGITIGGVLGDQQAALVGQLCFESGSCKSTYGTGCFMLYNTGKDIVYSKNGLLTTVAFQLLPSDEPKFALEGSVAAAGSTIRWLRDNLKIISKSSEVNQLAQQCKSTDGIYFVNAFSGLYAPYWRPDARGLIIGLTDASTGAHIARAAIEAVAFSSRELIDATLEDTKCDRDSLNIRIDGGMSASELLPQYLADFIRAPISRPKCLETTALGAAIAAGIHVGFWKDHQEVIRRIGESNLTFKPRLDQAEVDARLRDWKRAVQRSFGWSPSGNTPQSPTRFPVRTFFLGIMVGAVAFWTTSRFRRS